MRLPFLIAVNVVVALLLLGAINLASAVVLSRMVLSKPVLAGGPDSPAYADNRPEMRIFFQEYGQLRMRYRDYIGWRREPFDGRVIDIDADGNRVVPSTATAPGAPVARFFGGSTMWGTGATNRRTIPALFAALHPEAAVYNHGETAFVARQSLALLIDILSRGGRADLVVFYDGVNDVGTLCRREIELPGMIRQKQFEAVLDGGSGLAEAGHALDTLFLAYTRRLIAQTTNDEALFDCSTDPVKATHVATHLVETWRIAHDLVEARGGRFIGLLQPVAYLGDARIDHVRNDLDARDTLGAEFGAVYPEVRRLMEPYPYLHDLSRAFDGDQVIYTDWAHVNGRGNAIIAAEVGGVIDDDLALQADRAEVP